MWTNKLVEINPEMFSSSGNSIVGLWFGGDVVIGFGADGVIYDNGIISGTDYIYQDGVVYISKSGVTIPAFIIERTGNQMVITHILAGGRKNVFEKVL